VREKESAAVYGGNDVCSRVYIREPAARLAEKKGGVYVRWEGREKKKKEIS
jgi:hypothetical protein